MHAHSLPDLSVPPSEAAADNQCRMSRIIRRILRYFHWVEKPPLREESSPALLPLTTEKAKMPLRTAHSDGDLMGKHSAVNLLIYAENAVEVWDEPPEKLRETWSGRFEFFLMCIGYCVGFGNIWRFPFLVYRNGGGAFLIPYCIFLVLCGIPLVLMEMALGQFSSLTAIHLFGQFSPLFKGLGFSMVMISFFVCIYYNTILSWVIYYLYASFSWTLPWSVCDKSWASARCFTPQSPDNTSTVNQTLLADGNHSQLDERSVIDRYIFKDNRSQVPSSEEFWNRHVLKLSSGVDDFGSLRTELVICLLVAWISVFLCSCKGIKTSGKVIYFTAICPFFMLIVLFIRGMTLPGSASGVWLFLQPDFARLKDFRVWMDAAMQIFYAMAPGWGGLLSFASYNGFHVNVYKYGVMIPILNFLTSMLGGLAVFSVIGYLSHRSGLPASQVVAHGPGLTFVAYPEALSQLPFAPAWSVLFFFTLFTIGIDSQVGMFETFASGLADEFPAIRRHRLLFVAASCALLFMLGLVCVSEAGMYWVQVIDWYSAFLTLLVICLVECCLVGWVYGADALRADIQQMIGRGIPRFWSFCWRYLTPATVAGILFCVCYFHVPVTYEGYVFPRWSLVLGWALALATMLPIPLYALYKITHTRHQPPDDKRPRKISGAACGA
ncbi:sodium- and chloride-dependent GABA transporter 1-like isoform X2 [Paramacrobiotus metropolitanus]|uniref:sodium- and chloride-dependent GABA transporter 1-like isoform X2 n=1 Tax=Paramacrobiotus metropolitanus TaxID=2943436 RepID=UPI00244572B6|nr:sodium- and chloride-dependent GABA transporter 1-like isoform X2 [Paramacrobiotus metropolitanus]